GGSVEFPQRFAVGRQAVMHAHALGSRQFPSDTLILSDDVQHTVLMQAAPKRLHERWPALAREIRPDEQQAYRTGRFSIALRLQPLDLLAPEAPARHVHARWNDRHLLRRDSVIGDQRIFRPLAPGHQCGGGMKGCPVPLVLTAFEPTIVSS